MICKYRPKLGFDFWCYHGNKPFHEKFIISRKNGISFPRCTICWVKNNFDTLTRIFFGDILGQRFLNFHYGVKCHRHSKYSKLSLKEPLNFNQNSSLCTCTQWNIGTNNYFFLFHKRIYEKTNHVFQMYIDNVSFILQDFFAKNVQIFQFPTREPPPSL